MKPGLGLPLMNFRVTGQDGNIGRQGLRIENRELKKWIWASAISGRIPLLNQPWLRSLYKLPRWILVLEEKDKISIEIQKDSILLTLQ